MKPLESESILPDFAVSTDEGAAMLADLVPLVMRMIRAEMRSHRSADLTVPQFRTLAFVGGHPGASLSELADHIGLTLPSCSKMVDRLEGQSFLVRKAAPDDRRRMCLELTPLGQSTLRSAQQATHDLLTERLKALSPDELTTVIRAMNSLQRVFGAEAEANHDADR